MPNQTNLKLLANNTNDLKVISAHLQDSILTTKNIANLKKNRLFLLEFNRFMWEDIEKGILRKNKRIRSILKIDNVISVQSKNINQENKDRFLEFLTIEVDENTRNNYNLKLIFAGDALIKITVEVIEVYLDDQGEPWESKTEPKHKIV
jgi:hypothetical protein